MSTPAGRGRAESKDNQRGGGRLYLVSVRTVRIEDRPHSLQGVALSAATHTQPQLVEGSFAVLAQARVSFQICNAEAALHGGYPKALHEQRGRKHTLSLLF